MRDEEGRPEEEPQRRRPRVVDKRVSARPSPEPTRGPSAERPSAEPGADAQPPPAAEPAGPAAEAGPGGTATGPAGPHPGAGVTPGAEGAAAGPEGAVAAGAPGEPLWTPEQEAEAQRLAQQLAEVSSRDWVLNTAVTFANVAAAKIDQGLVEDSRLAIDSLAALLNAVGSQLGEAEQPLRQTLAQLQFAYAQSIQPPPTPQP